MPRNPGGNPLVRAPTNRHNYEAIIRDAIRKGQISDASTLIIDHLVWCDARIGAKRPGFCNCDPTIRVRHGIHPEDRPPASIQDLDAWSRDGKKLDRI
jgi:hypothetical protein